MTKGKIIFYVTSWVVLAVMAYIVYSYNHDFFQNKQVITILDIEPIKTGELSYAWHFFIVFAIGFLVREYFRIVAWFGKRKESKELNRKVRMQQDRITALENELELIRGGSSDTVDYAEAPKEEGEEIVYSKEGI